MLRRMIVSSALGVLIGCSGSSAPDVVPAGGTITYKGAPVPGASVTFAAEGAPAAIAITDEQGRFALRTGTQEGAVPGKHSVSIYAVEATNSDLGAAPDGNVDPEAAAEYEERATAAAQKPPKWLIPRKYGRALTSGLSYEVKAGEPNQFDIQLTD